MNLDDYEVGDRVRLVWENMCGAELEYEGVLVEEIDDSAIVDCPDYQGRHSFTVSMIVEMEKTDQRRLDNF